MVPFPVQFDIVQFVGAGVVLFGVVPFVGAGVVLFTGAGVVLFVGAGIVLFVCVVSLYASPEAGAANCAAIATA